MTNNEKICTDMLQEWKHCLNENSPDMGFVCFFLLNPLLFLCILQDHVFSVDISPDGRWVASGSCDRSVRIWGIHNAVVQCILHDVEEVWAIEFSPAGGYLASSGFNGVVRLWKYSYITR